MNSGKIHEVGFVIKEDMETSQLMQVCFDSSNAETGSSEVRGLVEWLNYFNLPKGTIITSDIFHDEFGD